MSTWKATFNCIFAPKKMNTFLLKRILISSLKYKHELLSKSEVAASQTEEFWVCWKSFSITKECVRTSEWVCVWKGKMCTHKSIYSDFWIICTLVLAPSFQRDLRYAYILLKEYTFFFFVVSLQVRRRAEKIQENEHLNRVKLKSQKRRRSSRNKPKIALKGMEM